MIITRTDLDFCAGPITLEAPAELADLEEEDRLLVIFADTEILFTMIGRARNAFHLGTYLTPWSFMHWRCEHRKDRWTLVAADRAEIARLRRFHQR